ncbi:trehalose synthase-fused probable maltokinase [Alkalispirochaeta americana]|uniref:Trehalose synthase-fused probable maltokinase n=1 Tax=Alkalispirochaeta americana TaxID=159291 RepID=A0A1N6XIK0_9SPIO|nr:hypothetical protein [Alkalispirochaeta americana]SIR02087.1 trehalose synthase-fused probable maltokinase [Alkalispirochaeta americana]
MSHGPMNKKGIVLSRRQWDSFADELRHPLEAVFLLPYLQQSRWFRDKARHVKSLAIVDTVLSKTGETTTWLLVVQLFFIDGRDVFYFVPLALALGDEAREIQKDYPLGIVAPVRFHDAEGVCFDGLCCPEVQELLLTSLISGAVLRGAAGAIEAAPAGSLRGELPEAFLPARLLRGEQSNSALLYREKAFLKIYRSLESGENPEVEILRHLARNSLASRSAACRVPQYLGSLDYRFPGGESAALGLLVEYVPNRGDGWEYATRESAAFFLHLLQQSPSMDDASAGSVGEVGEAFFSVSGGRGKEFLEKIALLARRTGELHRALLQGADCPDSEAFGAELFTVDCQRSLVSSLQAMTRRVFGRVREQLASFPDGMVPLAEEFVGKEETLLLFLSGCLSEWAGRSETIWKIRLHGDYHLGQVLFTGSDFVLTDFEGEPARPLQERRQTALALRDVAGMLRSFHYAGSLGYRQVSSANPESPGALNSWVEYWYARTQVVFLEAYLKEVRGAGVVPENWCDLQLLLKVHMLEKAVYEVDYELDNRPEWIWVPLKGICFILEHEISLEAF